MLHYCTDDQGWIHHMMPSAAGWKGGKESGIYAFKKPGWPPHTFNLPQGARIVAFIGKRKPIMYERLPWVRQYWVNSI